MNIKYQSVQVKSRMTVTSAQKLVLYYNLPIENKNVKGRPNALGFELHFSEESIGSRVPRNCEGYVNVRYVE